MRRGWWKHMSALDTCLEVMDAARGDKGWYVFAGLRHARNGDLYEVQTYLIRHSEVRKWRRIG